MVGGHQVAGPLALSVSFAPGMKEVTNINMTYDSQSDVSNVSRLSEQVQSD